MVQVSTVTCREVVVMSYGDMSSIQEQARTVTHIRFGQLYMIVPKADLREGQVLVLDMGDPII
jgi:hypothetical protein